MSTLGRALAEAAPAMAVGAATWGLGRALGLGDLGAGAAIGLTALAAGAGTWRWGIRPAEDAARLLVETARTGAGSRPDHEPLAAVHDALAERERHHAEARARLQAERDRGWQVIDTSPLAIALLDPEGRFTWVNQTFRTMLRPRAEPRGRRPLEVVSVVELDEVVGALLTGASPVERPATTRDLDLELRGEVLPSGDLVVRAADVTVAREAERSRTDFVGNVSHELRTPAASILGYLDLALAEPERLPADVVPLLETALRNGRRLRDLFEDLLKLHRIEARRRELPLQRLRLAPIVAQAVGPARDRAAMRGQTLTVTCPPELEASVNPEALGQILSNLAANASNYSAEGAPIEVRASRAGSGARIDVVDRGIGIAERHQERIFERFYRVDEGRSRSAGGTGLGLAIVKHFAKASGCRVTLASKEGRGSTFSVHLPG